MKLRAAIRLLNFIASERLPVAVEIGLPYLLHAAAALGGGAIGFGFVWSLFNL